MSGEAPFAKKSLGQHFLHDPAILKRIALSLGPLDGEAVIEVGPGPGGLTRALLTHTRTPQLIAIEKDARMIPALRELATSETRLCVVEGDALAEDEEALLAAQGQSSAVIIANLPYNVATPLIIKWLRAGPWRRAMALMVQREVALRIAARAGESAYGRLSVMAQSRCAVDVALHVAPGAFTPPPKVASAVVRFTPLPAPYQDWEALERVTAAAFGQRRKMLRSSLKILGDSEGLLAAAALPATARAEDVDQDGFRRLAQVFRARG